MQRTLHHLWLSAQSRMVRIILAEKGLEAALQITRVWERPDDFLALNPAGTVPVLIDTDGTIVTPGSAIVEYLEERYGDPERPLIGDTPAERAEARRLAAWFDDKFEAEVTGYLVEERVMKRFLKLGQPDTAALRAGLSNIRYHLDYIAYLVERRRWLAGERFSIADIAAAAHLSCIDYLGDVPWDTAPPAREWYRRVKCRPSVRPLLDDHIPGISPPQSYRNLDF